MVCKMDGVGEVDGKGWVDGRGWRCLEYSRSNSLSMEVWKEGNNELTLPLILPLALAPESLFHFFSTFSEKNHEGPGPGDEGCSGASFLSAEFS